MAASYYVVIALFLLEVSTRAAEGKVSIKFCEEARMPGSRYPPIEAKCCEELGRCGKHINPSETQYGVTNTDPVWPIRLCGCEVNFYNCVTREMTPYDRSFVHAHGLSGLKCFWPTKVHINGANTTEEFEIRRVVDVLSLISIKHPFASN